MGDRLMMPRCPAKRGSPQRRAHDRNPRRDTVEVMAEIGLGADEVAALLDGGVIVDGRPGT